MRIIQLTDLHVGEEGELGFGVDVRANFLKILQATRQLKPDRIVVTGDLCMNSGVASIYQWMKGQLDGLGIPYDVISGNHDDPMMMAAAFEKLADVHGEELYFHKKFDGVPCLYLDTTIGEVSITQLNWLKECLLTIDREIIIFMHHPPMLADVPWMDERYPFQMREAMQEVLFAHPHAVNVFCGHYHVERTMQQRNLTMHITPSCYFQIDAHSQEFKIHHYNIALREIELEAGMVRHSVFYF